MAETPTLADVLLGRVDYSRTPGRPPPLDTLRRTPREMLTNPVYNHAAERGCDAMDKHGC